MMLVELHIVTCLCPQLTGERWRTKCSLACMININDVSMLKWCNFVVNLGLLRAVVVHKKLSWVVDSEVKIILVDECCNVHVRN